MNTKVNKSGLLVQYRHHKDGLKTYACTNRKGLDGLIYHLLGRDVSTFPQASDGLPQVEAYGVIISSGLHIWSACEK